MKNNQTMKNNQIKGLVAVGVATMTAFATVAIMANPIERDHPLAKIGAFPINSRHQEVATSVPHAL